MSILIQNQILIFSSKKHSPKNIFIKFFLLWLISGVTCMIFRTLDLFIIKVMGNEA
jgi:hypothetical protein